MEFQKSLLRQRGKERIERGEGGGGEDEAGAEAGVCMTLWSHSVAPGRSMIVALPSVKK